MSFQSNLGNTVFMFTTSIRGTHFLTNGFLTTLHEEILLHQEWPDNVALFPPSSSGGRFFCGRWWFAHLDTAGRQRSITMMQISKRQIKMRQKFTNRFWKFWRACWGISMVDALLRAERVRYWTFSIAPGSVTFLGQEEEKRLAVKLEITVVF